MSNSEEPNIFSIMCRLCLSRNVELIDLYVKDEFNTINSSDKILEIIERFTTVKVRKLQYWNDEISCHELHLRYIRQTIFRREFVKLA